MKGLIRFCHFDRRENSYSADIQRASKLNQHLPRLSQELVYTLLDLRLYHHLRLPAMGTGQSRRGPEQAADQRTFSIDLATFVTQMRTTQFGQRRLMFRFALDRQPRHLFAGGRHRSAAVVTTGYAFKGWDALPEEVDFLIVSCH